MNRITLFYILVGFVGVIGITHAAINYSEYFPNGSSVVQSQSDGWTTPINNSSKEIMTPEGCRIITSSQGSMSFIPTRTMSEWVSFRDHMPSGMSIGSCAIPINGVCATVANRCLFGNSSGYSAGSCGGAQTWSCDGINGGSSASCSIANSPCKTWRPYLGVLCDGDYQLPGDTCPSSDPIGTACSTAGATCSIFIGSSVCRPGVHAFGTAVCN